MQSTADASADKPNRGRNFQTRSASMGNRCPLDWKHCSAPVQESGHVRAGGRGPARVRFALAPALGFCDRMIYIQAAFHMVAQLQTPAVAHPLGECDLCLQLLTLGHVEEIVPFLRSALQLIVEVTQAQHGYLELHHDDDSIDTPRWWIAQGLSDEEISGVRRAISRGIIAEALASGDTVNTPSALLDPRFSERESVRLGRIEA